MDVKERQRLRNQVSAQQSRIKKKEEVIQLKKLIRNKNHCLDGLHDLLMEQLDTDSRGKEVLKSLTQEFQQDFGFDQENCSEFVHGDTSKRFSIAFRDIFITKDEDINKY